MSLRRFAVAAFCCASVAAQTQSSQPDWPKAEEETMRHYQALIRFDTTEKERPAADMEDGPKGFGAHSDQERLFESELHRFVRFNWDVVTNLARAK